MLVSIKLEVLKPLVKQDSVSPVNKLLNFRFVLAEFLQSLTRV